MPHQPSIVRASYILTLLRVARSADGHETIRFIKALASEYPQPDTPDDLKPFEAAAIDAVKALATELASADKAPLNAWDRVSSTAAAWLHAAG